MMIDIIPNWHPIFVHFTIGILLTAVVLFFAATLVRKEPLHGQLATVARWNLWLGVLVTLATVAAGFLAFNSVDHGGGAHAPMLEHRNWALSTAPLFVVLAGWSLLPGMRKADFTGWRHGAFLALLAVAGIMLATTGYKGGELVFRYGVGVISEVEPSQSEPEVTEQSEDHDHSNHHH